MKTIKSVLIGALVALLGSSAWAATVTNNVSVSRSESYTVNSPLTIAAKITLDEDAAEVVAVSTNSNHFVFTGKKDGKVKVTLSTASDTYLYIVKSATLTATKTVTVDPSDQTKATIEIVSHILPGMMTAPTNNILFLGSTCTSHGLGGSNKDATTAKNRTMSQINTLAKKGRVMWYLFGAKQNNQGIEATGPSQQAQKPLEMEDEVKSGDITAKFEGSMHRNLKAYLTVLNSELDTAHKNYDYIVLSFDGGRLAIDFSSYNQTQAVAQKLRWYYEHDRVIWITESAQSDDAFEQYKSVYYRPASTHDDGFMKQTTWETMVALLDPATYLDKTSGNRWTEKKTNVRVSGKTSDVWAATRNDAQATYDNPTAVEKLLNERIKKPMAFDQTVADVVNTNGLEIVDGTAKMSVSYDGSTWTEVKGGTKVVGNVVTGLVTKIGKEAWTKLEIPVQDMDGRFLVPDKSKDWILSNDVADVSIWYADPNAKLSDKGARGPAVLTVEENDENTGNKPEEWVTGEVETSAPWVFQQPQLKTITATSVTMYYNGSKTNIINVTVKDADDNTVPGCTLLFKGPEDTTWSENFGISEVTNMAYVSVAASKAGYTSVTNDDIAYITINPRTIGVTAQDGTKVYGSDDPDLAVDYDFTWGKGAGVVPGKESDISNLLDNCGGTVAREAGKDIGGYDITNGVPFTAGRNYTVTYTKGTFTITPAQITNDPTESSKPWAHAIDVELWTNDCVSVLKTGTNIIEKTGLYYSDSATCMYSLDDPATGANWKTGAQIKGILNHVLATQVWCQVTCEPNYYGVTNSAWVIIRSRESKPDDTQAEEEDKLVDADGTGTTAALKTVLSGIVENKAPAPGNPGWAANQLDADVQLKVTSLGNLPEDEMNTASNHLAQTISDYEKDNPSMQNVEGRSVDVKLIYYKKFRDGSSGEEDIGGSNETLIPFKLAIDSSKTVVAVFRYSGDNRTQLSTSSGASEGYRVADDKASITIWSKTYCEFIILTGEVKVGGNPVIYNLAFALKTPRTEDLKCRSATCTICSEHAAKGVSYVSSMKTRRLRGILASCTTCEGELEPASWVFVLWDESNKKAITRPLDGARLVDQALANGCSLAQANGFYESFVYGKKMNKSGANLRCAVSDNAVYGYDESFGYELEAVAFGSAGRAATGNGISSACGQAVGTVSIGRTALVLTDLAICDETDYCDAGTSASIVDTFPTCGTFQIRRNRTTKKDLQGLVPSYMR